MANSKLCIVVLGCLFLPICVHSQETVESLVHKLQAESAQVRSGRIVLDISQTDPPLTDADYQHLDMDSNNRSIVRNLQSNLPPSSAFRREIVFDNDKNILFAKTPGSPNVPEGRERYDAKWYRVYSAFPNQGQSAGSRVVLVNSASTPPMILDFWRMRYANFLADFLRLHREAVSIEKSNSLQEGVIINIAGLSKDAPTMRVKMLTKPVCMVVNIEIIERKFVEETWNISYALTARGINYPTEVRQNRYRRLVNGESLLYESVTHHAASTTLNFPTTDGDFDFGKYPEGVLVSDRRFTPNISYYQRKHQFTDEELFLASKDRSLLDRLENQPNGDAHKLIRTYMIVSLGLLIMLIYLFMRRRTGREKIT